MSRRTSRKGAKQPPGPVRVVLPTKRAELRIEKVPLGGESSAAGAGQPIRTVRSPNRILAMLRGAGIGVSAQATVSPDSPGRKPRIIQGIALTLIWAMAAAVTLGIGNEASIAGNVIIIVIIFEFISLVISPLALSWWRNRRRG